MKSVANVQPKVVDTERQEPVVGNKEDPSVIEVLVNQLLQSTQGSSLRKDRPTAMGRCAFLVETAVTGSTSARK